MTEFEKFLLYSVSGVVLVPPLVGLAKVLYEQLCDGFDDWKAARIIKRLRSDRNKNLVNQEHVRLAK